MRTSDTGINLIKEFEGCDLKATKCLESEKYYTIGYGHYGADVKKGQTITRKEALELLKKDLPYYEKYVNEYYKGNNQKVFDVLVSFCYNCGPGNLKKLCEGRNIYEIANKILVYNKSGGVVIKGLKNRREKERKIILEAITAKVKTEGSNLNMRKIPNGEKINSIPNGSNIYILEEKLILKNEIYWIKILFNNKIGYVAKKYISR